MSIGRRRTLHASPVGPTAYSARGYEGAADLRRGPRPVARRSGPADRRLPVVSRQPGAVGRLRRGHLPGAIPSMSMSTSADPKARGAIPSPTGAFARRLGGSGSATTIVVAYDDVGGWVAARLWWMLDDLGHRRVAVLDGGVTAWTSRRSRADDRRARGAACEPHARERWTQVIDRDELAITTRGGHAARRPRRAALPRRDRADRRVRGPHPDRHATPRPTRISARTVGSSLPPISRLAIEPSARWRQPRSSPRAAAASRPLTTRWRMRLAGLPDPILYVGSYSDWTRAGYPVATGADPGDPT